MGEVSVQRERRAETVRVYLICKRDSYVIVAQLSPEFTARLVDRWQELEAAAAKPAASLPDFTDPAAAAIAWAEQYKAKQALAAQNAAQAEQLALAAPKAAALDLITASDEAVTMTQAAKMLGIKREALTNWMHANGWIYRQNGSWVGYDQHIKNGRLQYKEASYTDDKTGQECCKPYCHILSKGLTKLAEVFGTQIRAA